MITGEFKIICDGKGCEAETALGEGINYHVMRMEAEERGWRIGNRGRGHAALCPACVADGNKPENAAEAEQCLAKAEGK